MLSLLQRPENQALKASVVFKRSLGVALDQLPLFPDDTPSPQNKSRSAAMATLMSRSKKLREFRDDFPFMGRSTIHGLIHAEKFGYVKKGRASRIPRRTLIVWLRRIGRDRGHRALTGEL